MPTNTFTLDEVAQLFQEHPKSGLVVIEMETGDQKFLAQLLKVDNLKTELRILGLILAGSSKTAGGASPDGKL